MSKTLESERKADVVQKYKSEKVKDEWEKTTRARNQDSKLINEQKYIQMCVRVCAYAKFAAVTGQSIDHWSVVTSSISHTPHTYTMCIEHACVYLADVNVEFNERKVDSFGKRSFLFLSLWKMIKWPQNSQPGESILMKNKIIWSNFRQEMEFRLAHMYEKESNWKISFIKKEEHFSSEMDSIEFPVSLVKSVNVACVCACGQLMFAHTICIINLD